MTYRVNGSEVPSPDGLTGKKFVFAGNRPLVLEEMVRRGYRVEVFAVPGSHLERCLRQENRPYTAIESRRHLVSGLATMNFDFFVANGCPYILPVSSLATGGKTFVNVHPGPLPDMRGMDPVPGALLFGRDSGAACHLMDDGVGAGPVISRVVVPLSEDLDAGLLYQISFLAEREAFEIACKRAFRPAPDLNTASSGISYTRKAGDLEIDFNEPLPAILRRIRAFSNRSQGARFFFNGAEFKVFDAEIVENPYLVDRREAFAEGEVVFRYENCLLVRLGPAFLKLKAIEGDLEAIRPGDILSKESEAVQPTIPAA